MFAKNDLVILKEEKKPIVYVVDKYENELYYLKGYSHRSVKAVFADELDKAPKQLIDKENNTTNEYRQKLSRIKKERRSNRVLYGRILHIDGDPDYLESCLMLYEELGISAEGIYIPEKDIKNHIEEMILKATPDIVVITGHDFYNNKGIKDVNNYENTAQFIEAVRQIRHHFNSDSMTVIVGACASHFEALLAAGANFASSPARINIHTYDPAVIAVKIASTSCNKTIDFENILTHIENGRQAFGGVETKGKMKIIL